MKYIIQIVDDAAGLPCNIKGQFLQYCDTEAHGGRGEIQTTIYIKRARLFDGTALAMQYYNRVSQCAPTRPDGKPNKPLAAYTVLVAPQEDYL